MHLRVTGSVMTSEAVTLCNIPAKTSIRLCPKSSTFSALLSALYYAPDIEPPGRNLNAKASRLARAALVYSIYNVQWDTPLKLDIAISQTCICRHSATKLPYIGPTSESVGDAICKSPVVYRHHVNTRLNMFFLPQTNQLTLKCKFTQFS